MRDDTLIMIGSTMLNFILLFSVFKLSRKYFGYSLIILVVYTIYFYYGYIYKSTGGAGLVWMVYLIFINTLHSVLSITIFLWGKFKKGNK